MAIPARILISKVPDIMIALFGIVKAQPEILQTAVILGSKYVNDYNDYLIYVGHRPDADATVPATRVSPGGLAPNDIESAPIPILLAVSNPEDDMEVALRRAGELQTPIVRGINSDLTLGLGKGVTSSIGAVNWQLLHTDKGAEVNVWWDVTVKAAL